ncbi:helix-turn-helix domain-containing protein [Oceanicella sp. SM1341]|uniref:helix-turn-helix domain-containing protein n=1 Tax=Oceanicella sp. SM1341 TaxID=1548889 RepID=UPI000E4D8F48|nr:helix-turn-helix domain-containing protein [Oceanicella sp. SM1341]
MSETKFLTPEEVTERYRGGVSLGTLRNWRTQKIGPSFIKVGKAVLYPMEELETWDERNKVQCSASKQSDEHAGDQP